MTISKVNRIAYSGIISVPCMDEEEKLIASRLISYGVQPTGNKATDKAKLHELEIKEAKNLNCISNKFLTMSLDEQEKFQEKKFEQRIKNNPELQQEYKTNFEGAKALGEQVYIVINLKNRK